MLVRKLFNVPGLNDVNHKCRRLVTMFRTSAAANERACQGTRTDQEEALQNECGGNEVEQCQDPTHENAA